MGEEERDNICAVLVGEIGNMGVIKRMLRFQYPHISVNRESEVGGEREIRGD